ncbi:MAG: energy transducer TonB [Flavobacteriales bacterium]|jgi:protein TonB|nr:energy transducer TonB [Flavobacteriales bacterium]
MNHILLISLLLFSTFFVAQEPQGDTTIYHEVGIEASFKIDRSKVLRYFGENVTYPKFENEHIQSLFFVKLTIEKDGSVSNVNPVEYLNHPTKYDCGFVNENKAVFLNMPKWNPAMRNGEPVRSIYVFPFRICVGR